MSSRCPATAAREGSGGPSKRSSPDCERCSTAARPSTSWCFPAAAIRSSASARLQDELAIWRGLSRLQLDPIPYALWSRSSLIRDGGRHRFDLRFLARGGRVILVGGYPIPTGRRAVPDDLRLHASSQWKIYARDHAETLLRVLDERPDL